MTSEALRTLPDSLPAPGTGPVQSVDATLAMALHSMAHAAGLAILAGPQGQASCRQVTLAAVAATCKGLLDIDFKSRSISSQG